MNKFTIVFFFVCAAFPEWPAHAIERGQDFVKLVSMESSMEAFIASR